MLEVEPQKVYEVGDVALILGVTPRTVKRYIFEGKLEGHRVGRRTFIRSEELCKCLAGPLESAERPLREAPVAHKETTVSVVDEPGWGGSKRSPKVQVNVCIGTEQATLIDKLLEKGRSNGAKQLSRSGLIRVGIELLRGLDIEWAAIANERDLCERARSALAAGGPKQLRL